MGLLIFRIPTETLGRNLMQPDAKRPKISLFHEAIFVVSNLFRCFLTVLENTWTSFNNLFNLFNKRINEILCNYVSKKYCMLYIYYIHRLPYVINSFILSKHFILLKVLVELNAIPTTVACRATCKNSHTYSQFKLTNSHAGMF